MAQPNTPPNIKDRLMGLTESILKDSKIPAPYQPIIRGLLSGYLKNASQAEIETIILDLSRNVLPFLLGIDLSTFIERLSE